MENRIENVEIKIAYQDDTLMQLNDVIVHQQQQIDSLEKLTQQLLGRVRDLSENAAQSMGEISTDERPPHY